MGAVTAAELMVMALEAEGARWVFGIPGDETSALMEALEGSDMRFVAVRQPSHAAFMADVIGRLTGRAGVCLASGEAGAASMVAGVCDAMHDRSPVLVLTGGAPTDALAERSPVGPVAKWSCRLSSPAAAALAVARAFRTAEADPPGPVHVDLPVDLASAAAAARPQPLGSARGAPPAPESVDEAAAAVRAAERPLLVAGRGAVRQGAAAAVRRLAERAGLPVVTTPMARGALPHDHPLAAGTVARVGMSPPALALADLLLCVGFDPTELPARQIGQGRRLPVVHVGGGEAPVDPEYPVRVEVLGDVERAARALAACFPAGGAATWYGGGAPLPPRVETAPGTVALLDVVRVVGGAAAEDGIVVSDVGSHAAALGRWYPARRPDSLVLAHDRASMGAALPGAMAARLAYPGRPVVCVAGDGSFLSGVAELETARRLGLDLTILVLNDAGYDLLTDGEGRTRAAPGPQWANPDFVRLAQAFGADAARAADGDRLARLLLDVVRRPGVHLVEVPTDRRESLAVAAGREVRPAGAKPSPPRLGRAPRKQETALPKGM